MTILRKIVSLGLGIVSSIGLFLGLLYTLGSGALIDSTLENSRSIDTSFNKAASYVEQFQKDHSRLPSAAEFMHWASHFPDRPYTPNGIRLEVTDFPAKSITEFGTPPPNAYLLVLWRGEWEEYYASWAKKSSLTFDKSKYYALGSSYADSAAVLCFGVLLLFAAFKIWPNLGV